MLLIDLTKFLSTKTMQLNENEVILRLIISWQYIYM